MRPDDAFALIAPERYVSRGGLKLEHALREFARDVRGAVAIDLCLPPSASPIACYIGGQLPARRLSFRPGRV